MRPQRREVAQAAARPSQHRPSLASRHGIPHRHPMRVLLNAAATIPDKRGFSSCGNLRPVRKGGGGLREKDRCDRAG